MSPDYEMFVPADQEARVFACLRAIDGVKVKPSKKESADAVVERIVKFGEKLKIAIDQLPSETTDLNEFMWPINRPQDEPELLYEFIKSLSSGERSGFGRAINQLQHLDPDFYGEDFTISGLRNVARRGLLSKKRLGKRSFLLLQTAFSLEEKA